MSEDAARQDSTQQEIVVGVDGSAASVAAIRWALEMAARDETTVHAVTVWRSEPLFGGRVGQFTDYERVRADWAAMLDAACTAATEGRTVPGLRQSVIDADTAEKSRTEAEVLTDAAAHARLLVVGSHGRGRLATTMLGSISASCVRLATCPVVVVPARLATTEDVPEPKPAPATMNTPGPLL